MLKKIVIGSNVVVASLVAFAGSASAIDYGTPQLPQTGSNSAGSFILAAAFVVCGVLIARFSSLRTVLRKN
jgi:LPXTG-motif cell wall-anchored protein